MFFIIAGKPQPKQRPRFYRGRCYTPAATREYEKLVAATATASGVKIIETGPVEFRLSVFMPNARRVDLDNIIKSVTDALNGICYTDDHQIVAITAWKAIDRENPRAEVAIVPWATAN